MRLPERVNIRLSARDRAAWIAAATVDGRTLSEWVKRRVNGDRATPPPVLTPAPQAADALVEAASAP